MAKFGIYSDLTLPFLSVSVGVGEITLELAESKIKCSGETVLYSVPQILLVCEHNLMHLMSSNIFLHKCSL